MPDTFSCVFSGRFKEWSFSSVEVADHLDDHLDDRLDHLDGQLDHPANILNLTNSTLDPLSLPVFASGESLSHSETSKPNHGH